ncbi:MAG TPA: ABC transporter substrate-binding protein [Thermoanaerobaculia bacterium]|nr:ABC transporter substrate-binding protein [Thermoanaerobaculia bacterium]
MRVLALFLLLPLLLGAAPQEERGRGIYLEGASPSGSEITAVIGDGGVEVPASALPCAGCHGRDGRGQAEGGVTPSNLTWESLTREGIRPGRRHPPYDERLLKRAIAMGIDPAGNPLNAAMPRYRMSQQDMADLISYIRRLGHESDPGVSDTVVRIGAVLPPPGPLSPMSRSIQAALAARFQEAGELWGRKIELRALDLSGPPSGWPAQVKDFFGKDEVFAVVGAFLAGADRELAEVFEEAEVPLVGPFTLHPRENRYVFHLSPGLEDQVQALTHFASREKLPNPLIFRGSGPEAVAKLRQAEASGAHPTLLATGSAADAALLSAPAGFDGRIFVAVPAPPGEPEAYRKLAAAHGLSRENLSAQLSALAAAEVLLEGLERSGRGLTRDRLIESLESLRGFVTGLAPPITFGPARRIGARGAYILKADLRNRRWIPAGGWVGAE